MAIHWPPTKNTDVLRLSVFQKMGAKIMFYSEFLYFQINALVSQLLKKISGYSTKKQTMDFTMPFSENLQILGSEMDEGATNPLLHVYLFQSYSRKEYATVDEDDPFIPRAQNSPSYHRYGSLNDIVSGYPSYAHTSPDQSSS
jgi:hypothetical protein